MPTSSAVKRLVLQHHGADVADTVMRADLDAVEAAHSAASRLAVGRVDGIAEIELVAREKPSRSAVDSIDRNHAGAGIDHALRPAGR